MLAFFRSRMKDITWFIVWFIVITFGLSLLGSGALLFMSGDNPSARRRPAAQDPTGRSTDDTADSDLLLASTKPMANLKLGNVERTITEGQLERRLRQTEISQGRALPEESRKIFLPLILERLVDETLVVMEAEAKEIDVSAKVQEQMQAIFERVGGKEQYLRATNQSIEELTGLLERQYQIQAMFQRARSGRDIPEADLKKYYEEHVADFTAEGAAEARPFEEVRAEVEAKLRTKVTDEDLENYYQDHKARWMLPPKAHLLHLAIDPEAVGSSDVTTPSDADLKAYYEAHKAEYKERAKVDLAHIFLDPEAPDIQAQARPTDEEIQKYYDENRDEFEDEPEARLSQILIGGSDGYDKAAAALARIKGGELFGDVAKDVSEDEASADGEGDLGWLSKTEVPEVLSRVVFEAEVGKITDPIRSSQGYHIVWVRERRDGRVRPLSEVRDDISQMLAKDKAFEVAKAKATELATEAAKAGADFAALAAEHSHAGASKNDGGRVGVVLLGENETSTLLDEVGSHGYLDFAIQKAIENVEPDTVLPQPVRSFKGVHVLKVLARPEAGFRSFESVRKVLESELRKERQEEAVAEVLDKVSEASTAEQFKAFIEEFSTSKDVEQVEGDWGMVTLDTTAKPELSKEVRGEVVSWDGLSRRIVDGLDGVEAGEVSEPIVLSGLRHVFFVVERPERGYRSFAEVKGEIQGILSPKVDEGRMREYFEDNKAEFESATKGGPEIAHALLVSKEKAEGWISQILNGQRTFEDLVASDENRDGATKASGGRLEGEIRVPSIRKAIEETASGSVHSKPVQSPVGWHVIRVVSREEAKPVTYVDVKDKIRDRLLEQKQREVEKALVQELRNRADVEVLLEGGGNPFASMLSGLGGAS